MRKQAGLSLSGLVGILFVLFFVAILGFKAGPPYMENATIQKIMKTMAANPELRGAPVKAVQESFDRARSIDNVSAISGVDLEINKEGANLVVSATYSVKVPLVANVSLLLDFAPSSEKK